MIMQADKSLNMSWIGRELLAPRFRRFCNPQISENRKH
jgi:hypothetical protein